MRTVAKGAVRDAPQVQNSAFGVELNGNSRLGLSHIEISDLFVSVVVEY